jgi:O-antigen biosynthesis protein
LLALAARRVVGHIPLPLANSDRDAGTLSGGLTAQAAHRAAVRDHLHRSGLADRVAIGAAADDAPLQVSWQPHHTDALVEVIVPTRDNGVDLREFVISLRQRAAAPGSLRVLLVDNGSSDRDTGRILAELSAEEWVRVVKLDEPFNWSRLNNRAAALAGSEVLVFANDDMVMLSDGWDRQLRGLLERPEVGAVGARLIYPDDSVQHAGILLGWPGIAVHDGRYEPAAEPGPCRRWHVTRAVAAVTGAFFAIRRDTFAAGGGFDEAGLPVAYGDIDFALKLRARGLKILWTPSITLRHYESKSRGLDHLDPEKRARNEAERRVMTDRWGAALQVDPGVNPAWHAATLPFRLISAPSQQRLWRHIRLCAGADPWLPDRCREAGAMATGAGSPRAGMLYPIEPGG